MTPTLFNVPRNTRDWAIFSLANKTANDAILSAIAAAGLGSLPAYQLDPINFDDIENWRFRNQQAHNGFNSALGLTSNDLITADFADAKQLSGWIYLNATEIRIAQAKLAAGVSSPAAQQAQSTSTAS